MATVDPDVVRYEVRVRADGAPAEQVYARAATNELAEQHAKDACREMLPSAVVRVVIVGDGRLRLARAAARERFAGCRLDVALDHDLADVTVYKVRARQRIAGGWREAIALVGVGELGAVTWADGDVVGLEVAVDDALTSA